MATFVRLDEKDDTGEPNQTRSQASWNGSMPLPRADPYRLGGGAIGDAQAGSNVFDRFPMRDALGSAGKLLI